MDKEVEVLVACMKQKDFSLYEKMNINTNAVFANQSDEFSYKEIIKDGNVLKMITTNDRGVGKNRNIAILFSTAKYLVFADEDLTYKDNFHNTIIEAFHKLPKADMIIFDLEYSDNSNCERTKIKKIKRLNIFNSMLYGAPRFVIKRESLLKNNLWFSLLYGGGAPYSSGEDSLFLREAFRKKLRIYSYPVVIATTDTSSSTWFKGYNEKYFFDKGILLANLFPKLKWIIAIYYSFKYSKYTNEFSILQIFRLIKKGIKNF